MKCKSLDTLLESIAFALIIGMIVAVLGTIISSCLDGSWRDVYGRMKETDDGRLLFESSAGSYWMTPVETDTEKEVTE